MAAYKSLQMTAPRYPVSGPGIGGRNIHCERAEFALTAAFALNDTVDLFYLHPGFRVTGGYVKVDDLDTNGTPTIVLAVGDAGDDDRYFTGLTTAQAGGINNTMAATGLDYCPSAKTLVQLKVTTAPATGATTGNVVVCLFGHIQEPK